MEIQYDKPNNKTDPEKMDIEEEEKEEFSNNSDMDIEGGEEIVRKRLSKKGIKKLKFYMM